MKWKRFVQQKKKPVAPVLSQTANELAKLTKNELKAECRKVGQKTAGNKNELIRRLSDKVEMTNKTNNSNSISLKSEKTVKNGHLKMPVIKKKNKRVNYVLWRHPFATLDLFIRELWFLIRKYGVRMLQYYKTIMTLVLFLVSFTVLASFPGPYQNRILYMYKLCIWCSYWCGLGVLSSIGLGTGLHTFLLYLGPHIAAVTLAAYECGSVMFPEPPYPEDIICPENNGSSTSSIIDIWTIMSKVRLEAMCWGAGTALGELPPYFMAKAARLSTSEEGDNDCDADEGQKDDSDDIDDFDQAKNDLKELEILEKKLQNKEKMTVIEQLKITVEKLVARVGFFGILACASIPNPLFDLAGITCGHFLVPFWTFFGATLIGKAVIKMHIQKLFVIIAFNESLIESALQYLQYVPILGKKLQEPFKAFLEKQKSHLHRQKMVTNGRRGDQIVQQANILSWIFEKFVILMVLYFVVSIVNSLAQSHYRRLQKKSNHKRKN